MREASSPIEPDWGGLRPHLDAAMDRLPSRQRPGRDPKFNQLTDGGRHASDVLDAGEDGGGRILVVDQAHPKADDTNPGTPEAPWLTIQQAVKSVRPGDRVCVMAGQYRGG